MDQHLSTPQFDTITKPHQFEELLEAPLHEYQVTLHPLTMRIFNSHGIYFPSKLTPKKVVSYEEFVGRYADLPVKMRVCFDESPSSKTMLQRSEFVTAYGFGLDCCYLATFHRAENAP